MVGSGPNGLAAAIALAREGLSTLVLEGRETLGGGMRTAELTLPGFHHDVCSAIHPLGVLSPFFRTLPLERYGLEWVAAPASVGHPLPGGRAAVLWRSLERTGETLGVDARAYRRLLEPFLDRPEQLLADLLAPLGFPSRPVKFARFGLNGLLPATWLGRLRFRGDEARALFAGCAAHAILPLEKLATAAVGLLFALTGHVTEWPCARGGSQAIADALAGHLLEVGGSFEVGRRVDSLSDLPSARVYLFDVSPRQLAEIAGDALPGGYRRRLARFRYGPGVFKIDWALSEPIPWEAPDCASASTVHVGGTAREVAAAEAAVWQGRNPDRPFVLVTQQSLFDDSRAPVGRHTGYAYCHVPHGSTEDRTEAIEAQIARFAPGFRDTILARRVMTTADLEEYNPNYVGGVIAGGAADLGQLFFRPVVQPVPYVTPNPQIYLCSASTPPGGGVHGMCGFHAARVAMRRLGLSRSERSAAR